MANTMNRPTETPRASSPPGAAVGPMAGPSNVTKSRVGRRALLVTATTATLCGVGALAAPRVIPALEAQAQAMERDAMLNEIGDLEGVSLDAAIRAAEITRRAVTVLVLPLAQFVALVGNGALDLLLQAVDTARGAMSALRLQTSLLDAFQGVVISWQRGVSSLPIALNAYLTADIASAEKYLRALKQLAEHPHVN